MYQNAEQHMIPAHAAVNSTEHHNAPSQICQASAALTAQVQEPKDTAQQTGIAQHSKQKRKKFKHESQRTNTSTSQPKSHAHGNYWTKQACTQTSNSTNITQMRTGTHPMETQKASMASWITGMKFNGNMANPTPYRTDKQIMDGQ